MKKIGRLYLITDTAIQKKYSHYQIAQFAIKGGADVIQLRDKSLSTSELIQTAIKIAALCRKHDVTFLINDRVDVALVANADGVHLGKEDIPIKEARKLLGKNKIIGGTAHSLAEALFCESEGADYIGFGHIYPTKTKYKPEKPKGTEQLKLIVSKTDIPVIAIGGISPLNIKDVMATGVHGAAVVGSVLNSSNPLSTLNLLRKNIYDRKK